METPAAPLVGGGRGDNPTKEGITRAKNARSPLCPMTDDNTTDDGCDCKLHSKTYKPRSNKTQEPHPRAMRKPRGQGDGGSPEPPRPLRPKSNPNATNLNMAEKAGGAGAAGGGGGQWPPPAPCAHVRPPPTEERSEQGAADKLKERVPSTAPCGRDYATTVAGIHGQGASVCDSR